MQDQYFGDVGDFAKYGLLRRLGRAAAIGVQWYRVPDGVGQPGDGRHVGYLGRPELHRALDPELFDFLAASLAGGRRAVHHLERSGLLAGARWFGAPLDFYAGHPPRERERRRAAWHEAALAALADAELVFVDPDNGLEGSVARGGKGGLKYVYLDELAAYHDRGQSLLVYHHLGRRGGSHPAQIGAQVARLAARFPGCGVVPFWARRGSGRVFILVARREHRALARAARAFFTSSWVAGPEGSRVFEPRG